MIFYPVHCRTRESDVSCHYFAINIHSITCTMAVVSSSGESGLVRAPMVFYCCSLTLPSSRKVFPPIRCASCECISPPEIVQELVEKLLRVQALLCATGQGRFNCRQKQSTLHVPQLIRYISVLRIQHLSIVRHPFIET